MSPGYVVFGSYPEQSGYWMLCVDSPFYTGYPYNEIDGNSHICDVYISERGRDRDGDIVYQSHTCGSDYIHIHAGYGICIPFVHDGIPPRRL